MKPTIEALECDGDVVGYGASAGPFTADGDTREMALFNLRLKIETTIAAGREAERVRYLYDLSPVVWTTPVPVETKCPECFGSGLTLPPHPAPCPNGCPIA